jgi:hypothetical protein
MEDGDSWGGCSYLEQGQENSYLEQGQSVTEEPAEQPVVDEQHEEGEGQHGNQLERRHMAYFRFEICSKNEF